MLPNNKAKKVFLQMLFFTEIKFINEWHLLSCLLLRFNVKKEGRNIKESILLYFESIVVN